jgi:glutamine amidotransferase
MQILYESSDEGNCQCLGILPGRVTALQPAHDRPVPHMGWNRVRAVQDSRLLPLAGEGAAPGEHFYFVHSYAAPMGAAVVAVADYGAEVPALVQHGNWLGAQFHPERSGAAGARLLQRFLEL